MTLTPRENFHRLMRRDHAEWLPLDLPMTPPVVDEMQRRHGSRDAATMFQLDFLGVRHRIESTAAEWSAALRELGCRFPPDTEYGSDGVAQTPPPPETLGSAYHLRTLLHPLECVTSVSQLETLPWPDTAAATAYAHLPDDVARIHAQGKVAHAGMECTVFERAWYARGMDLLYMDLIEGNGISDWLLDWHTRRSVHQASAYARAGVDVIGLGDDIGTQRGMMMSRDFWKQHLAPRLAEVVQAIRRNQREHVWVKYHSDGDIRDVMDDLLAMGIDIINPVQPECMPHEQVVPRWQSRAGFWGLIGTQTTMPFGTVDDVRQAVSRLGEFARRGAAIVVAPTHVLEPDVPWENIEALVRATRSVRLQ